MPMTRVHREELLNALTHGAGVVASLAGGGVLITLAALSGDARRIIGASVFVFALILLYAASTLYHAVRHETTKARLEIFDHCAIFVLIAGTYTPFTLVSLRGGLGWGMFATIWLLAVAGIVFKLYYTGRFRRASTLIYLAMGWLVLAVAGPLSESVSSWTLAWLVMGGVAYSAGTVFYHNQRLPYSHGIWHLFVLGGSVCHFAAVLLQVADPEVLLLR
jgi:hemolysin III